ncbi:putative F-box protein [Cardamine amara subsp. amara]|uniref:F-box protein n=1 Tax=Cardamine amara subsp. amara TaxID=228776 RepID=A0ABD1B429_CARAN
MGSCLFGYDPLKNQYKVLFIPTYCMEQGCQVFTLGDPTAKQWRTIQSVGSHCPLFGAVCIDGVVYYRAKTSQNADPTSRYKLMSFDVRSEKFYHVNAPETLMDYFSCLINYQGKLGFVCCMTGMEIWVREDGDHKTQGWSNIFFYEIEDFERWYFSGVTRGGEIVLCNMIDVLT